MSKQMRELQARKSTLVKEARALTDRAAADNRDMSDEEVSDFDALKARIESASASIDREASLIAEEAQMAITAPRGAHITVTDNRQADLQHGFGSVGEFMQAVYQAEKPGKALDERLLIGGGRSAAAPGSFANESAGQDGGFMVPPQFSQQIFQLSLGEDSLLPMTDNVEITGSTGSVPFSTGIDSPVSTAS